MSGKSKAARKAKEHKLIGALGNSLRRDILKRMRDDEPVSPRELADELHLPVSNIAYHIRVLANCDAVALVRVKPVRGAVQHFYRRTLKHEWARVVVDGA